MWTSNDLKTFEEKGIPVEEANRQMECFRSGFPYVNLSRPATVGDGIRKLDDREQIKYVNNYEAMAGEKEAVKFVTASGSATRMLKDLFEWNDALKKNNGSQPPHSVAVFLENLEKFPFYRDLRKTMLSEDVPTNDPITPQIYPILISCLLGTKGLNYGYLPKGLLLFHSYPGTPRTAFEEHLVEAALYGKGKEDKCRMHFTVSPEHQDAFLHHFLEKKPVYEKQFHVTYEVGFSVQKPSTDTIAADLLNNPFRDKDGRLVFRPGGHGALLENLQRVDADIIFIKNIDNVTTDHLKATTIHWKKVLGGILLTLEKQIKNYLSQLQSSSVSETALDEIILFVQEELHYRPMHTVSERNLLIKELISRLDRPIRVCGMVRNEGEPGGGPYWVKHPDGSESLQIVELSQIDLNNGEQQSIVKKSTHFNPVDIVCNIRKSDGTNYNLSAFRDPSTGFISVKSKDGKKLKAIELPGLWNGSMAWWNTIFVEVPIETFTPVKTINDLLRNSHQ